MRGQRFRRIKTLYYQDFPVKIAPTTQKTSSLIHSGTSAPDIIVQVAFAAIDNDDTYKIKLQDWTDEVNKFEKDMVDTFLNGHVVIIVDDLQDGKKLIKKLAKIPVMHERKRKAFTQDLGNQVPCDWPKLKKRRLSMFQCKVFDFEPSKLDCLMEVYTRFRTETETKDCEDTLLVMVPGAPPNMPFNKIAEVAVRATTDVSEIKNCKQT